MKPKSGDIVAFKLNALMQSEGEIVGSNGSPKMVKIRVTLPTCLKGLVVEEPIKNLTFLPKTFPQ